ncbi:Protein bark beetle [Amphibalanus amphitrite]|uniref:Protein bark beetle n=1 Tax=Amphibalanus amphitrite TaxID=1232801 RepID=A0A6A4WM32_AMPAM|nr:Protein bark beetle [Amphibalanus amphitrite]
MRRSAAPSLPRLPDRLVRGPAGPPCRTTGPCRPTTGPCGRTTGPYRRTPSLTRAVLLAVPAVLAVLLAVPAVCRADTEVGGVYSSAVHWDRARGPYLASSDVLILAGGSGGSRDRIVLTTAEPSVGPLPHPSLRLVDGPTPWEGRVQIFHRHHWRSVCTNSRNWTEADRGVACSQLGFSGGEYADWYPWLNGTRRLLYPKPDCTGAESRLQDCNWQYRAMGAGVCDEHADLAIRCDPVLGASRPLTHWRGLRFEHASYVKMLTAGDTLYEKFSNSKLYHVDVLHAGMGPNKEAQAAIESVGVPPRMYSLTVRDSVSGGINVTQPDSLVAINNCTVSDNAGIGMYFNTSTGLVHVHDCHVHGNGADGLKLVQHELQIPRREVDGAPVSDFCSSGTTLESVYPIVTAAQQYRTSYLSKRCQKTFRCRPGLVMTVNFLYLANDIDDSATLSFYDGTAVTSPLLGTFQIRNGTRPQSVVTTRNNLLVTFSARNETQTEVLMAITAGDGKAHDLNVSSSIIANNNGRGIAIENIRSLVHIHRTIVANNSHVAGVHVLGGAGDVNITWSHISGNLGDGVNVTYAGGNQNISWCDIRANSGRGVSVWFNETRERVAFAQELVVSYSNISANLQQGLFVGNYCRSAFVNISGNVFWNGKGDAVDIWSCWNETYDPLKLQVGHNRFIANEKLAINMAPVANMVGTIEHNFFFEQRKATMRIFSGDTPDVELLPVRLKISDNYFERNRGIYVVSIGASQFVRSSRQNILFTRNFLLRNTVAEPFPSLNPRNRVSAVVTVSSATAIVYRNILQNPGSRYELGVHFEDQSSNANASHNWFGYKRSTDVYDRIFDRKDRYNLARADFEPFLLSENDPDSSLLSLNEQFVPSFGPNEQGEIGGEIDGQVVLPEGTLKVTRDIFVRPTGRLTIAFGVRLLFPHSVGMMVAGHLHAEGSSLADEKRITFGLQERGIRSNVSLAPVRLVGGKTDREGRLQVLIGNEWGTVCNHGWSRLPASLACQQLGWVLNPADWTVDPHDLPPDDNLDTRVLMSSVQCSPTDTDLTRCQFEGSEDIENTCSHQRDVTLRCYDVTWAGVRFGVPSKKNILKNVQMERAGLVDYSTYTFGPALRLDFNHHVLEHVTLSHNDGDGLGIMYSDIYKIDDVNHFKHVESRYNRGHGIAMRTAWLDMTDCRLMGNQQSGLHYEPSLSRSEQRELVRWIAEAPERKLLLPSADSNIVLKQDEPVYLITMGTERATDKVFNVRVWQLRRDFLVFPVSSSSYQVVIRYLAPGRTRGGAVLLLTAVRRSDVLNERPTSLLRRMVIPGRTPRIRLFKSAVENNRRGISAHFYDSDLALVPVSV